MRQDFYIRSADGVTKLHCTLWQPEGEAKAVVQLVHGMGEQLEGLEAFALYLNARGFAVIGQDLLGHGRSVRTPEDRGFFAEQGGLTILMKDLHHLTRMAKEYVPGKKVFLLGYRMGAFLARCYSSLWGGDVDGMIAVETASHGGRAPELGKWLSCMICRIKGSRFRSRMISLLAADRNFFYTAGACHTLFTLTSRLAKGTDRDRIPRDLPIYIVAGPDDLNGAGSKDTLAVYNDMVRLGIRDLDLRFYEKNEGQELLHEANREIVFADLAHWMEERS